MKILIFFFYLVPFVALNLATIEVEFEEGKHYRPLFVKAVYFALSICPIVNLIVLIRFLSGREIKIL